MGIVEIKNHPTGLIQSNGFGHMCGEIEDISSGNIRIKKFLDELSYRLDSPYHFIQTTPTIEKNGENTAIYCVKNNFSLLDKLHLKKFSNPSLPILLVTNLQYNPKYYNQSLDAIVVSSKYYVADQLSNKIFNTVSGFLSHLSGHIRENYYPSESIEYLQ